MLKAIQNSPEQFEIAKILLYVCKKSTLHTQPKIDFISLEKQIEVLRIVQGKTIEQIVEFVDVHLEDFIRINEKFTTISDKINSTDIILGNVNEKLQKFRQSYYEIEGKMQKIIDQYQKTLIKQQVMKLCNEEAEFISQFNQQFEKIINKNVDELTFREKHLITRFTYKYIQYTHLFSHQLVKQQVPQSLYLEELLQNLQNEVELYLSQQLTRSVSKTKKLSAQYLSWFSYLQKKEHFYEIIQDHLVGRQLITAQKQLIANKPNVMSGKDEILINNFFKNIFSLILQLPEKYPQARILNLITKFLQKKQLSFLYTYMMPVFALAYSSYMQNIEILPQNIKKQLKNKHNWNLKMWADFRTKNILDRSQKDNDIMKWLDIVFKKNCMLEGVKSNMVRLALQLINKYCSTMLLSEMNPQTLNLLVQYHQSIPNILSTKIAQAFGNEQLGNKLAKTVQIKLKQTIETYIQSSTVIVSKTCINILQPYKSLIMKLSSKKLQPPVNKADFIFKPLVGFIKSNENFSEKAALVYSSRVKQKVQACYETGYKNDIMSYCKNNVTAEQADYINHFLGQERQILFS